MIASLLITYASVSLLTLLGLRLRGTRPPRRVHTRAPADGAERVHMRRAVPYLLDRFYWCATPQDLQKKYSAKWAVVTGASSGIGRAVSEKLAAQVCVCVCVCVFVCVW